MKQDLKDRPFKLPWLPLALLLWFGLPLVCKCSFPLFFFFHAFETNENASFQCQTKITSPPEPEKMDLHSNSVPLTYYSSLPQTSWLAKKWSAIWVHFLLRRRRRRRSRKPFTATPLISSYRIWIISTVVDYLPLEDLGFERISG